MYMTYMRAAAIIIIILCRLVYYNDLCIMHLQIHKYKKHADTNEYTNGIRFRKMVRK